MPRLDALPLCPTNNSENEALPLCPTNNYQNEALDTLPLCPTTMMSVVKGIANGSVSGAMWAKLHPAAALRIRQNFVNDYGKKYAELVTELLKFQTRAVFDESYKAGNKNNINPDKLSLNTLKKLKDALREMKTLVETFNVRNRPDEIPEMQSSDVKQEKR
jgi:gas vesicle protein